MKTKRDSAGDTPEFNSVSRRSFCLGTLGATAATCISPSLQAERVAPFQLKYLVASCLYGYAKLDEILPEVSKSSSRAIDVWPKVHGNQREQVDEVGEEAFANMLKKHKLDLGCITQYKLGPFGLRDEIKVAQRLGCKMIVCGGKGPVNTKGAELKSAIAQFIEKMKPHLELAEESGVTIAVENHARNLIESPDSLKWLAELRTSKNLAIAFAPYHLEQNSETQAKLIRELGDSINLFYAWQHAEGSSDETNKKAQRQQMPGRGPLDFAPLLNALRSFQFSGWTSIFMHPTPRGIPIGDSPADVTAEINFSRKYLEALL